MEQRPTNRLGTSEFAEDMKRKAVYAETMHETHWTFASRNTPAVPPADLPLEDGPRHIVNDSGGRSNLHRVPQEDNRWLVTKLLQKLVYLCGGGTFADPTTRRQRD